MVIDKFETRFYEYVFLLEKLRVDICSGLGKEADHISDEGKRSLRVMLIVVAIINTVCPEVAYLDLVSADLLRLNTTFQEVKNDLFALLSKLLL